MEEEFITFETARLAKEKGFPVNQTMSVFKEDGEVEHFSSAFIFRNITDEKANETKKRVNLRYETAYGRPEQSMLQKWLRDVKHYHISIQTMFNHEIHGKKDKWEINITNLKTAEFIEWKSDKDGNNTYEGFDSYEQALEFGLQETLNMIQ